MTGEVPRHSFDWLINSATPVEHTVEIPVPGAVPDAQTTLRVVITASARIKPTAAWGLVLTLWGMIVVALLTAIMLAVSRPAHGATWEWTPRNWAQQEPGRTTTYRDVVGPDGRHHRCAISQWRGEPVMQCD
jgi:hypothetical protein